jgi:rod shape-determining protein MreB and related proteins
MDQLTNSSRALRVFLCHSSDDKAAVRALYRRLLNKGFDPWFSDEKLIPGQNWLLEISKAVRESDLVLVCLSKNSVTKRGVVQKEIKFALDVASELPEGIIFVIPIRLEECDLPERLKELHWVNLFEETGFERLTKTLEHRASSLETKSEDRLEGVHPTILSRLISIGRELSGVFSNEIAIDCGESNTWIYVRGRGIVLSEPTIVLVNQTTEVVDCAGREAREKTQSGYVLFGPLKEGLILDSEIVAKMFRRFIAKALRPKRWIRAPSIVLPICPEVEPVYRRALIDSAYRAGAWKVYLVESVLCAAIGAGLSIDEGYCNMVVDIGAGTCNIATIALNGIIYSRTVRVASAVMDLAIIQYIRNKHNVLIGPRTAEAIKIELGSAYPLDEPLAYEVRGRHLIEGIPKTITLSDEEVREALADCIATLINAIRIACERTPPELGGDIVDRGIMLTGGGALLKNLDKRISIETGLPVAIADDPLVLVILGAGKLLSDPDLLKKFEVAS